MAAPACTSWIEVETALGHMRRHWCEEVGVHVVVLDERRTIRWSA